MGRLARDGDGKNPSKIADLFDYLKAAQEQLKALEAEKLAEEQAILLAKAEAEAVHILESNETLQLLAVHSLVAAEPPASRARAGSAAPARSAAG